MSKRAPIEARIKLLVYSLLGANSYKDHTERGAIARDMGSVITYSGSNYLSVTEEPASSKQNPASLFNLQK